MANGSLFFSFKVGNHQPLESGLDRSTRMHSPLDLVVLCFGCRLTGTRCRALKLGKSTKKTGDSEVCWSFEQSEIDTLRSRMTPWPGRKEKRGHYINYPYLGGSNNTRWWQLKYIFLFSSLPGEYTQQ